MVRVQKDILGSGMNIFRLKIAQLRPRLWLMNYLLMGVVGFQFVSSISMHTAACEFWVAPPPLGNDTNSGSRNSPWASIEHAAENIPDSGCVVWFKPGVYSGQNKLEQRFSIPAVFKAEQPYQTVFEHDGSALKINGGKNLVFEGFEFRHSSSSAGLIVIQVQRSSEFWAENITFRNNIIHDSYNNDLLKVYNGSKFVTIENNVFYNQGDNEQHLDINSVTDVVVQDNIFFNDFAGSGRSNSNDNKAFITIKDSNANEDGLVGSERVTIRRNIFLNWEGGIETFLKVGNDGEPYFEAKDVLVENNLMIGNSTNQLGSAFGVSGARNVTYRNNTVVGDLPSSAYAFRVTVKQQNPQNENIFFYNNIWSDPTGTMGADLNGRPNEFSDGDPAGVSNLILDNNFYWNDGAEIPPGELVSPTIDDARFVTANPKINSYYDYFVFPRWNGTSFISGTKNIREEFVRLVMKYGSLSISSEALGIADPDFSPSEDILGRHRPANPSMGAYDINLANIRVFFLTLIYLTLH